MYKLNETKKLNVCTSSNTFYFPWEPSGAYGSLTWHCKTAGKSCLSLGLSLSTYSAQPMQGGAEHCQVEEQAVHEGLGVCLLLCSLPAPHEQLAHSCSCESKSVLITSVTLGCHKLRGLGELIAGGQICCGKVN